MLCCLLTLGLTKYETRLELIAGHLGLQSQTPRQNSASVVLLPAISHLTLVNYILGHVVVDVVVVDDDVPRVGDLLRGSGLAAIEEEVSAKVLWRRLCC